MTDAETLRYETCGRAVDARRRETYGDLDPDTWRPLCCPTRGSRLKPVFVGDESSSDRRRGSGAA